MGGTMFAIVTAVLIFTAGMLFVNFLQDDVTTFRATDNMNCSNSTISDGSKLTCLGGDIALPYFIFIVVSAAIAVVVARFTL